ncbi:MAG: malonyl-ACP O-methyltransferase BioC [Neisseria sp.]|nr:malonyl-ACP O-methyltransferase BioC [Neisseria sp.]
MNNTLLIQQRFQAALAHYDEHALAQQRIAQRLLELLPARDYARVLELGCGSGGFTRLLYRHIGVAEWYVNDLNQESNTALQTLFRQPYTFLTGDAAQIAFPENCDLICAASCLQWIGDMPALLAKISAALQPNGIVLFNTFTADNLHEIKTLTGQGLHYPSRQTWQKWYAPHFTLHACHDEKIVLSFDDARDVLRHLQKTGVTAAGEYRWTRGKLAAFERDYRARFHHNGQFSLTYTPRYFVLEKRG